MVSISTKQNEETATTLTGENRTINPKTPHQRVNVAGYLFEKPKVYQVPKEIATLLDSIKDGENSVFITATPKEGDTLVNILNTEYKDGVISAKSTKVTKPDINTPLETVIEGEKPTYSKEVLAKAEIKNIDPKYLDYDNMKLDELKAEAVNRGLDLHSKMKVADLKALLINSDKDETIKQAVVGNGNDGKIEYPEGSIPVEKTLREANAMGSELGTKPQDLDQDNVIAI